MQSWINQFGRDSRISFFASIAMFRYVDYAYLHLCSVEICWFASSLWRWLCVAWSVRVAATPASAWKWGNRTMASLAPKSCKLQGSFVFNIFRFECFQVDYFRYFHTEHLQLHELGERPLLRLQLHLQVQWKPKWNWTHRVPESPTHRPAFVMNRFFLYDLKESCICLYLLWQRRHHQPSLV